MATYIYINDSSANTWQIGVDDNGILSSSPSGAQTPPAVCLNDYATNTTSWQLSVDTTGRIGTQQVTYSAAYPMGQSLVSPGGYTFTLEVDVNGIINTTSPFLPDDDWWAMTQPERNDFTVMLWF